MTNKKLQVVDVNNTALEAYGNRQVVRELVDRLMAFHPASKQVGERGMRAAAQLAILMGASPLPGLNEIHIWDDNGKPVVTPGINYWRRRGERLGGIVWSITPRPMNEDERVAYGIADGEHGAICEGVKLSAIRELRELELPINLIMKSKAITGIGTCRKKGYPKKGRPIIWTALKRAETDFFKRAFPYQPGEQFEPGAGMVQSESGHYEPDYGPSWGALDVSLHENGEEDNPLDDMSGDEFDEVMFGSKEEGEIINITPEPPPPVETVEFDDLESATDPRGESSPQAQAAHADMRPTANGSKAADMRAKLQENGPVTWATLASAVIAVSPHYDNNPHIYNAAAGYPELPDDYSIVHNKRVKVESVVKIFDWLLARKEE